jgi:hypothetical protein
MYSYAIFVQYQKLPLLGEQCQADIFACLIYLEANEVAKLLN